MPADLLPPSYSKSISAPSYSPCPLPGEHTFSHFNSRSSTNHHATAFTFNEPLVSFNLKNCRGVNGLPTYAQGDLVQGHVTLEERESVLSVAIKLEGQMLATMTRSHSVVLFSNVHTLWRCDTSADKFCPRSIPFSLVFPSAYNDHALKQMCPLPPSCSFSWPQAYYAPCPEVSCVYTMTVIVIKVHNRLFLRKHTRTSSVTATLIYSPVSRPFPSIPVSRNFSGCEKSSGEWHKETWISKASSGASKLSPIQCQFSFPSSRDFGASETIPFRLRLHALPSSLKALLKYNSPVRVSLTRRIIIKFPESRMSEEYVLGDGQLDLRSSLSVLNACGAERVTLDWDGKLCCTKPDGITNSGFVTNELTVQDFITVSLAPFKSSSLELQRKIPINLVVKP
ncbi:hypothetical protein SERLA73DRAFT_160873 [Serpula lacrymans var. lacrymans S7.3]|uniref:Arrestin-like N-terminal domain-containing protein n=2 Tax=Serpula lacrymans var. lacrymans TaxID=341189 RepID=F8Q0H0_SERL3|nr:uncharacterized protein SERLADRAFT_415927 [Serpula lacrymans var. lacrymans S7.9]EGN97799.1 hypothetical protein SERLA73DRAFT_160873 [Serpula lacrymans var. lacrymans S7.3]EGO23391.1 hypothetical protein SERLADRAFT_415927 [Serpula lacrymans var. lacrymans S7.9]